MSNHEERFGPAVVPGAKPTNPKDAVGVRKVPLSTVPAAVLLEAGVAMLEGARKYGRHNYRKAGVRASVYYDATLRHLIGWWEGEDIDPDSGLSHITKGIATLIVLRDAMLNGKWADDRPPRSAPFLARLNELAGEIIDRYPDAKAAITQVGEAGSTEYPAPALAPAVRGQPMQVQPGQRSSQETDLPHIPQARSVEVSTFEAE